MILDGPWVVRGDSWLRRYSIGTNRGSPGVHRGGPGLHHNDIRRYTNCLQSHFCQTMDLVSNNQHRNCLNLLQEMLHLQENQINLHMALLDLQQRRRRRRRRRQSMGQAMDPAANRVWALIQTHGRIKTGGSKIIQEFPENGLRHVP